MKKILIIVQLIILSFCLFANVSNGKLQTANDSTFRKLQTSTNLTNGKQPDIKAINDNATYIIEPYSDYIKRLNIFVTISLTLFGFFVALQLISNGTLLRNSKNELEKIREISSNYENKIKLFEEGKKDIFKQIHKQNEIQFNNYINNYRSGITKNELLVLIESDEPDVVIIFRKLSEIVNSPDKISILIYSKCLDKFPDNKDIIRVCKNGLCNFHDNF